MAAEETEVFTIKTLPAQMRYDVTELSIAPAAQVKIIFENSDAMPHNMVFFQPGTDVVAVANKQLEKPEEAVKRNWLPEDPRMWLHSKLLNPNEREEIDFKAPDVPGIYPFVCTFPGHAVTMQGRLKVFAPGPKLSALKFQLFLGDWKKLPDFSALTAHREGEVPGNLIELKLDDYKNQFGVVYTGRLVVPKDGEYTFGIAGDDGVRLLIDGKRVVEHDGVHPASEIREGKSRLKAGERELRLEYFQATGEAELYVAWRGSDFGNTPLSKWVHPNWKSGSGARKKETHTGIPLVVGNEPIVYRNFIAGAGNRAIAVGYPGGANVAWSAETMNLGILWRGAFIDAARHWRDRGAGHQPPLGYDLLRPVAEGSLPFARWSGPGETWPRLQKKERAAGYQWKGYRLDAKRFPTFYYQWGNLQIADRIDVEGDAVSGGGKMIRTLRLTGEIPSDAYLLVAQGESIQPEGDGFRIKAGKFGVDGREFDNQFFVTANGGNIMGKNLVTPARGEIRVIYRWLESHPHPPHAHGN